MRNRPHAGRSSSGGALGLMMQPKDILMGKICAYCWASGLVEFGSRCPKGALPLVTGPEESVKEAVEVLATHSRNSEKYLVPKVTCP